MSVLYLFAVTFIQINPDTATVGDPLRAIIRGEITDSIHIIIPDSFPDILLLDTLKREGDTISSINFSSFSTGPQVFQVRIKGDTLNGAYFIRSVLTPENKGLSPIWGPYGFFNWHNLFWVSLGPFGFLVYYLVKRRREEEVIKEEPEKEPGEEALGNLSILEGKVDKWNWNRIYTSLSYIVRRYIERKSGIPAVEATTSELLRIFKKEDSGEIRPLVHRFPRWDLIKFADIDSNREEFDHDLATARFAIENMEEKEDDTLS